MREWGKQQKQKEQPHSFQSAIINWRHTSKPNFLHETGPLTYFVNERSWNNTAFILNPRSPFSLRPHFHSLRYRAESTTHYFRRVGKINRTSSGLWGPFISLFFFHLLCHAGVGLARCLAVNNGATSRHPQTMQPPLTPPAFQQQFAHKTT